MAGSAPRMVRPEPATVAAGLMVVFVVLFAMMVLLLSRGVAAGLDNCPGMGAGRAAGGRRSSAVVLPRNR